MDGRGEADGDVRHSIEVATFIELERFNSANCVAHVYFTCTGGRNPRERSTSPGVSYTEKALILVRASPLTIASFDPSPCLVFFRPCELGNTSCTTNGQVTILSGTEKLSSRLAIPVPGKLPVHLHTQFPDLCYITPPFLTLNFTQSSSSSSSSVGPPPPAASRKASSWSSYTSSSPPSPPASSENSCSNGGAGGGTAVGGGRNNSNWVRTPIFGACIARNV